MPRPFSQAVEPHFHLLEMHLGRSAYLFGCSGDGIANLDFKPRQTKLPVDPTLIIANGYLKCKMVKATIIDPRILITDYPAGYFGDFESEGQLVIDWFEIANEPQLKQLFDQLVRIAKEPNDWERGYNYFNSLDPKLADFRNSMGFTPELLFEFVGDVSIKIEINVTTERVLIQSGDRWEQ